MRPSIFNLSNTLFYIPRGFDIKTHSSLCDDDTSDKSNSSAVQFIPTPPNSELKTSTGICNKIEADMIAQHVASLLQTSKKQVHRTFLFLIFLRLHLTS
jgi:hypothetical protein